MGVAIALAVGFTGTAATLVGSAINIGAAFGLSYASSRLTGKQNSAGRTASGASLSLAVAADAPRVAVLGEAATYGSLVYWHLEGAHNTTLCMVVALADHECDGLAAVYVDGAKKTLTGENVDGYNEKLRVRFYAGAPGQVADADVIAGSNGKWTANHRGAGVCYAVVWADYDAKLFPGGVPKVLFVVRGAKLLDPRTDTTAYSDNWGVCVYNLLRGIRQGGPTGTHVVGLNATAASISHADAVAACNASDELVALAAGGTEKRYRAGVVLTSDMTARRQLELLLAAGGDVVESAGLFRVLADVAQSPAAYISDADAIVDAPLQWSPRAPRSRLINTVEATWLDPAAGYTSTPLPARSSSVDRAADGGIRLAKSLDLSACPSATQAQRVMEITRRSARRQGVASMTLRAAFVTLEPGDWIAVSSDRYGWVDRLFMVTAAPKSQGLTTELSLAEVDEAVDDWSTGHEIASAAAELAPGAPSFLGLSGLALTHFTAEAMSGEQRPGLRLAWSAVTDETVVAVHIEYRPIGAEAALRVDSFEPTSGGYSWLNGVQGGLEYEARAIIETLPPRTVDWSGWVQTSTATPAQVVSVAAEALYIDPANIPPAELTAQEKFELALMTAIADVQGSAAGAWRDVANMAEQAAAAAAEAMWASRANEDTIFSAQKSMALFGHVVEA